jgi:hypothetical protein
VVQASAQRSQSGSVLERFLAHPDGPPIPYRALRRLEAHNAHFGASGWLEAWTEFDAATGFHFEIIREGGSPYICKHVLRAALEGEQRMWRAKEPQRASLTLDNYVFRDEGAVGQGLASLSVKPRRKDVLLIDGAIFVRQDDGELTRIEGQLSKAPSLWTRRVEIVRRYEQISGVRMPVSIESVAHVLIAGRSTFTMTYQYESINGEQVGIPQPPAPPSLDR